MRRRGRAFGPTKPGAPRAARSAPYNSNSLLVVPHNRKQIS